jgi:multisubunit Na+/H+ antiporter MnhC subunit
MDTDPKEFDKLQKLLASKKKEKPEEGFFDRFSDRVLTRLEEPAPKPTLWERLNDQVDPLRAAAAIFAVVIGVGVLFALGEGSNMAETEPEPLGQAEEKPATDPLGQAQNTLAGSGLPLNKSEAQPPRIFMNPDTGLSPREAKVDPSFYRDKSASNTVHTPK